MARKERRLPLGWSLNECTEPERAALTGLMNEVKRRFPLPGHGCAAVTRDFQAALRYFRAAGVSPLEAARRLDCAFLGDFYAPEDGTRWYKLDDSEKIYPLSMSRNWMAMFRVSVTLREPVVPQLLQIALLFAVRRWPFFATSVKQGFFWHYIDGISSRFAARPERLPPCAPIRISGGSAPSFRVVYTRDRISAEFFHILTDGTGGMAFLTTLLCEYARLLGAATADVGRLDARATPDPEEWENAFSRIPPADEAGSFMDRIAVRMRGRLSGAQPARILHFDMAADAVHAAAKARGATVTAFLLACLIHAVKRASRESDARIQVQVPVNMRKMYQTATMRNFSLFGSVRIPWREAGGVEEMLPEIARQLRDNTSREAMQQMATNAARLVRRLRWVPAFIKRPAARLIYGVAGDKIYTSTLSNMGVVSFPPEIAALVRKADVVLGAGITNRASCAVVTVSGVTSLSITKMTRDPAFENALYDALTSRGIAVRVSGSETYGS